MQCRMKQSIRESQVLALQELLLSSVSGEDIDTNVYSCTLCTNCVVQRNEGMYLWQNIFHCLKSFKILCTMSISCNSSLKLGSSIILTKSYLHMHLTCNI